MRYIVKVRIRGFQSHADTTLEFGPGLNAITGPTDNGKSAVIRALKWWAWNQAPDDTWVRLGCTLTTVEVTMSDGTVITRERRNSRNRYLIQVPGQPDLDLVDFGRKVPDEVIKSHGMIPVPFDPKRPSILNLATQLESPFFLTAGPTERADILGRLAGVHVIDHAADGVDKDLRALRSQVKEDEAEVAKLDDKLSAYLDLDDQDARVSHAEGLLDGVRPMMDKTDKLKDLALRLSRIDTERPVVAKTLERLGFIARVEVVTTQSATLTEQISLLGDLSTRWVTTQNEITITEDIIRRNSGVEKAQKSLLAADVLDEKLRSLRRLATARDQVLAQIATTETTLQRHQGVDLALRLLEDTGRVEQSLSALKRIQVVKNQVLAQRRKVKADVQRLESVPQAEEAVNAGAEVETKLAALKNLRQSISRINKEEGRLIDVVNVASLKESADDLASEAMLQLARVQTFRELKTRWGRIGQDITKQQAMFETAEASLSIASTEYGQALQEAGVCPTCLQAIEPAAAMQIAASMNGEAHHHG